MWSEPPFSCRNHSVLCRQCTPGTQAVLGLPATASEQDDRVGSGNVGRPESLWQQPAAGTPVGRRLLWHWPFLHCFRYEPHWFLTDLQYGEFISYIIYFSCFCSNVLFDPVPFMELHPLLYAQPHLPLKCFHNFNEICKTQCCKPLSFFDTEGLNCSLRLHCQKTVTVFFYHCTLVFFHDNNSPTYV